MTEDREPDVYSRVKKCIKFQKGQDFLIEENLITDGYLDSFDLLFVITKLEEEFQISIPLKNVTPERFNSVKEISEMIREGLESGLLFLD